MTGWLERVFLLSMISSLGDISFCFYLNSITFSLVSYVLWTNISLNSPQSFSYLKQEWIWRYKSEDCEGKVHDFCKCQQPLRTSVAPSFVSGKGLEELRKASMWQLDIFNFNGPGKGLKALHKAPLVTKFSFGIQTFSTPKTTGSQQAFRRPTFLQFVSLSIFNWKKTFKISYCRHSKRATLWQS